MTSLLLIEDEPRIADFVCAGLALRGYSVQVCGDGESGLQAARRGGHALVLLDLMLPGRDGLEVLRTLRAEGVATPVILLTARNALDDRVQGLNCGADDFLAKPFYVEELAARIQALLRRLAGERQQATLQAAGLVLDRMAREVRCQGRSCELTTREFNLLEHLMRSPGTSFTRTQLLEHVWGYDFDPSTNVVDVCVQRLRRKIAGIDPGGEAGSPIEAVRGVGYRFRQGL